MKGETEFVVLAALLHDIGKLFERSGLFSEAAGDEHCLSFCPVDPKSGRPSYLHSAYTRAFCDWLEEKFDCLRQADDRSWKDWAAAHHRDETSLAARVVRLADLYSASEREPGQFYTPHVNKRTLLEPVLERVSLRDDDGPTAARHRIPLKPLTTHKDSFFPASAADLQLAEMPNPEGAIDDPSGWYHLLAPKDRLLTSEYTALGKGLLAEIDAIARRVPGIELRQLLVTLTTLLERYTVNVPSATNVRHPDISLFDHLRTAAAIAQALYLYQMGQPLLEQGLDDRSENKWLLVCGDFSGIQRFIYRLTNKGAAKGLRGRSFYVQMFCRLSADFILRRLDLNRAALLHNSGGKFYLLLPSVLKDELFHTCRTINRRLADRFGGEVFLGVGATGINAAMFKEGEMHRAWEAVHRELEKDRLTKFRDVFLQEPGFFAPQTDFDPTKSCQVCGARSGLISRDEGGSRCGDCDDLQRLGGELGRTGALLTAWGKEEVERVANRINRKPYVLDALDAAFFLVPQSGSSRDHRHGEDLAGYPLQGEFILLNHEAGEGLGDSPLPCCSIETLYLGKWEKERLKDGNDEPWDFEEYASRAVGIKRLGILRMDVDNLGMIFMEGLNFPVRSSISVQNPDKKPVSLEGWGNVVREPGKEGSRIKKKPMASLSRMATLSRQLNTFFSGYVPKLLENEDFNRCQVVYAGGDDLFIIGSWDQLPTLAKRIRNDFTEFSCRNPSFTISGGLTLIKPRYPIYRGARLAGEAESQAKNLRRVWCKGNSLQKDAFCFLGVPVTWQDWELAEELRDFLQQDIQEGKTKGFLAYLRQMAAGNAIQVQNLQLSSGLDVADAWRKLKYDRWRWLTAYQLRRRYGESKSDKKKREIWSGVLFASSFETGESDLPVYSWLELPVRWVEYLNRKGGKSNG